MHPVNIFVLSFLSLFLTSKSFADSSCWPEEQLIGKTAKGIVEGINFKLQKVKSPVQKAADDCSLEIFMRPEEKLGSIQPCKQIECIKGECGDGGDYTSIPVDSHSNSLIQVTMKDGKKVWLKLQEKPEVKLVLSVGRVGTIFPVETKILDAPNGKPIEIKSSKKIAYTVLELLKIENEEWAKVEINPILSEEPPVRVGKSLRIGYFKHKNNKGQIATVLSDIWCD